MKQKLVSSLYYKKSLKETEQKWNEVQEIP